MSHRRWAFRIQDMVNAARQIERYTEGLAFEEFLEDEKTMDAVMRQLTIIGEAASHIPEEILSRYPGIPWAEIRGMRNVIVHAYLDVNTRIVWETVKRNLPELLARLEILQAQLKEDG